MTSVPAHDDGSACTTDDHCEGGTCGHGGAVICEDADACSYTNCDPATGACATVGTLGNLEYEDFAVGTGRGWDLQGQWQVGAAVASSGQTLGNPDPASDANTVGGWLVGTAIGGNLTNSDTGGYLYATSPIYDLSALGLSPATMTVQAAIDAYINLDPSAQAMRVEYSLNGGGSWTTALDYTAPTMSGWAPIAIGPVTFNSKLQSLRFRIGYKVVVVNGQATTSGISFDNFRMTCTSANCACN